jgi:hypothetical protein
LSCINRFGGVTVQIIYRASLLAVWLGILLALSLSVQAAPSVPNPQELAQQRFQLPNPMSREYMQVLRNAPMHYEAPVDVQTPAQPQPTRPETN